MRKVGAIVAGLTLLATPSAAMSGPGPDWKAGCEAMKQARTKGKPSTKNRNAYGKCVAAAAQARNAARGGQP